MISAIKRFIDRQLTAPAAGERHSEHQLQLATAALLLEMARADHQTKAEELEVVAAALRARFGLSQADADELLTLGHAQARAMTSLFPITTVIKERYDGDEKGRIIELMWWVALSDNELDMHEEHLIRKVAGLIYVPREAIVAAKQRAIQRLRDDGR